ncbi:hypothetical protein C8N25_14815 [Algoriphagus antarcticus]|uniref:Uncharacterized protein n=1 Tax=Algoriphagus antarcticus TaxID=238540 RepID=A0A3E0D475_9BACT|nr:hypothetical protein C8N25_14815 [Algoriphagus antarcticus]
MKKVILVFSLFILGTGISLAERKGYSMEDYMCSQYSMWSGCDVIVSSCVPNSLASCDVSAQVPCEEVCVGGV